MVTILRKAFIVLAILVYASANTSFASPLKNAEKTMSKWQWLPMNDMRCRDGSSTGIGIRLQPNTKAVMIYLQGGGACYDADSCAKNSKAAIAGKEYSAGKFNNWVIKLGNQGIFNTRNNSNPVAGWNHVFIPYCTGDLHGGIKRNASVPGVREKQQFVGYQNVQNVLKKIAPYFRKAEDVALVGASAGGFGVLLNYPQVVRAFNGRSVAALVDSAPIIPESSIKTSCFQRKLINTFNLQLPPACPTCKDAAKGGLINLFNYLGHAYPHGRFALASADADLAGVVLYNDESKKCRGGGVNIINYRFSLYALRDKLIGHKWATFLPGGVQHTMTQSDHLFLNRKFKGITAAQWLSRINYSPVLHIPAARLKSNLK